MGEFMDKVTVPGYWIPDTSWYSPLEMKGCPRDSDVINRKRKRKGWLPKRVRQHPKMKKIFGKAKLPKPKNRHRPRKVKTTPERFNRLVEKAYKNGKL